MTNSTAVPIKDMVLGCLSQMLRQRGDNIRSGWGTVFGVFATAAKENYSAWPPPLFSASIADFDRLDCESGI